MPIPQLDKLFIIGDRLNTANGSARRENGASWSQIERLKARQLANGVAALDVCASGHPDEQGQIARLMALDGPSRYRDVVWSIDTLDPAVIAVVVPRLGPRCLLNCCSGLNLIGSDMLGVLQQVENSIGAVIALCIDEQGYRVGAPARLDIARRMVDLLAQVHIEPGRIIFDAVTLPILEGEEATNTTLETYRLLREEFPISGVLCATSNYSFGSSARSSLEQSIAEIAKQAGANIFLSNGLDAALCRSILGAEPAFTP